jgi:hypothetical protein
MSLMPTLPGVGDTYQPRASLEYPWKSDHSPRFRWCHSNSLGGVGQHLVHRVPCCLCVIYPGRKQKYLWATGLGPIVRPENPKT